MGRFQHSARAPTGFFQGRAIGGGRGQWFGGHHGECGAPAYNGGLGRPPSRVQAEPLVRWTKSPEAESILFIGCPTEPANLVPFQKCICISTVGATVMIWEKFCRNPGGQVTPLPLPRGAHGYGMQYKEDKNQAGMSLTPPPPPS